MNAHTHLINSLLVALAPRSDLGKFWKQNTGAYVTESGAWVRYGLEGAADISGILITGKRIEIEGKTGTGRQTAQQRNFEAMITKYNGVYLVARDINSVLSELEKRCL